jgi:hypothetical protein
MSVHHISGAEQATITGPATINLSGNDDAPVIAAAPAPTLASIAPTTFLHGEPDPTVTLTGTNFFPGSDVLVDGAKVPSTYQSATQMTIQMPCKSVAAAGTADVAVRNGSQVTAPKTFTYT